MLIERKSTLHTGNEVAAMTRSLADQPALGQGSSNSNRDDGST